MQDIAGAVIAAAGLGSRLGMGMPKCMIEVNGRTMLSRLIEALTPNAPIITVVTGYREDLVIEYCAKHHPKVVITRNPDFRTTNTAYSFDKGSRLFRGKVLYLDGDLVVSPQSLDAFLAVAREEDLLIGLTRAKSHDAVFVNCESDSQRDVVTSFSRTKRTSYEWGNIFSGPSDVLRDADGYVYERLQTLLPARGAAIELHEVDTLDDLHLAVPFAATLDADGLR